MASNNLGIAIFIIGILMLAFTFFLAYNLYEYITTAQQVQQAAPATGAINSTSSIVQSVINGVIGSMPINKYAMLFLGILVLYALANISFKIAKLGIEFMRSVDNNGGKQKTK